MEKYIAEKLASKVTSEEIYGMIQKAELEVKDWSIRSKLNPGFSLGAVFNILTKRSETEHALNYNHIVWRTNIIWELGDYLDIPLAKNEMEIWENRPIHHEEPHPINWAKVLKRGPEFVKLD